LTTGKYYYEFTVESDHIAQVGWVDLEFVGSSKGGLGVGDDKHSWGYDGNRVLLWFNGQRVFGSRWQAGSIIGCAADLDNRVIRFSTNGNWSSPMGIAWRAMRINGGLSPGFTIQGGTLTANWGDNGFKYKPPSDDYEPVANWLVRNSPVHPVSESVLPIRARSVSESSGLVSLRVTSGFGTTFFEDDRSSGVVVQATAHYSSLVASLSYLTKGKYYYEVVLRFITNPNNPVEGRAVIGWANKQFFGDSSLHQGVGDAHSWGLSFTTNEASTSSFVRPNATPITQTTKNWQDQILGISVDLDLGNLSLSLRGAPIVTMKTVFPLGVGLVPAFSINEHLKIEIRLGEKPLSFKPEGYDSIHEALLKERKK